MAPALPLRAAITRGAFVTLANWPTVAVDFAVESLYKFALAAPVLGGAFMVALLLGADVQSLLGDGLVSAADQVLASLGHAPAALWAFVAAAGCVALGGAVLMYVVKSGTLAVIAEADRQAGEIQRAPISHRSLGEAKVFSADRLLDGIRHYRVRSVQLGFALGVGYVAVGSGWGAAIASGSRYVSASSLQFAWPIFVLAVTTGALVVLAALNLLFDLVRVVVATEDCGVATAAARVRRFLVEDARHVLGIFGLMGLMLTLAMAAAITATAALTLVAWVPLAGFIFIPLQAAFWVVRGLLFQFMGFVTIAAYQTQYRRYAEPSRPVEPIWMREP